MMEWPSWPQANAATGHRTMAAAKTDRFMMFSPAQALRQFRLDINRVQWRPGIEAALKADRADVTVIRVTAALQSDGEITAIGTGTRSARSAGADPISGTPGKRTSSDRSARCV